MAVETTIKGFIYKISPERVINEGFKVKDVVIEEVSDPIRPQFITLTFSNGRIDNLAGIQAGDKVEVKAYIQGRKVIKDGKEGFFNSISAYKLNKI